MTAKASKSDLTRQLGLIMVFCIASGAMISSGIFILPGIAHSMAGPAVIVSYLLAGCLALMGLLSIAELTTAMPRAGGDYFYISRGMGSAAGTIAGLLSWFCLSMKSAFALVGLGFLAESFLGINSYMVSAAGCLFFVFLNIVGVKEAARLQVILVIGLLILMAVFIVKGFGATDVRNFEPFAPKGISGILSTVGFVFVSYGGLLQVASIAGETKRPGFVIPTAMISAVVIITIAYTLMVLVASGSLGAEKLNGSMTPISDAAFVSMGTAGKTAMGIAALLAFITTANAGIMSASRYIFALSEDGLLPAKLRNVNKRFNSPHTAIFITGGLILISVFVSIKILVETASVVFIAGYILACLSVIILRESNVQNYRPTFKAPFYPWLQVASIILFLFVIFEMGQEAYLITLLLIVAGFAIYWFYGKKKSTQESALLHLIERLTAKELVTGTLESELKTVIRQRDDIVTDRFDHLVEKCIAVDIEKPVDKAELFKVISENLSQKVKLEPKQLLELFEQREQQGSTVLSPFLAVPHALLKGKETFNIMLVRCQDGIKFSDDNPQVKMVFAIAASTDERNFYLRVLASVAQIVQNPGFEKRWLGAKNPQGLRDVMLLASRGRN